MEEHSDYFIDKRAELEKSLFNAKAKYKSDIKTRKGYSVVIAIGAFFLILNYIHVLELPIWLTVIFWIMSILLIIAIFGTDIDKSKSEVDKIEAIKRVYLGFSESSENKTEYFDILVKINIENLDAYYSLVKAHTSKSFNVSLFISIIGFVFISGGLILGFNDNQIIGYVSVGAGIISEFISGILFYLYNKTVRQMKEYHDSLINVQNILLSFKLIEDTTDHQSKAEMIPKMLEYLVQKKY